MLLSGWIFVALLPLRSPGDSKKKKKHLRSHAKDNESPDLCWTSVTSASSSPDAARSMGDMAAVELCGVGYPSSLALGVWKVERLRTQQRHQEIHPKSLAFQDDQLG